MRLQIPICADRCRYYHQVLLKDEYGVDNELVRQYFPLDHVVEVTLQVYQELLSLKFTELSDFDSWHEEVRCFVVHDEASGDLVGHFYMDLHPREGKYGQLVSERTVLPSSLPPSFHPSILPPSLPSPTGGQVRQLKNRGKKTNKPHTVSLPPMSLTGEETFDKELGDTLILAFLMSAASQPPTSSFLYCRC